MPEPRESGSSTVTSHDVARAAGVAQPTVSRALRNLPGVSPQTRTRILKVAADLGYVPIEAGRNLVTRTTKRVGIIAAELSNPYFTALVQPMHAYLQRAGYRTVLIVDGEEETVDSESLLDGSLDGILLTTSHVNSGLPDELAQRRVPFVLVGREVNGINADTCVIDNARGAALAAQLLLSLGHRRLGALFGPRWTSTGRDRERAFRARLKADGIVLERQHAINGAFSYETGYEGLPALMATRKPPTAVFCANDVIALGACNAAKALGIAVPRQLTVVGFDDIGIAAWDLFQLTTIRADLDALAHAACELLLRRLADPEAKPDRVVIPVELVLRQTHRAPDSSLA